MAKALLGYMSSDQRSQTRLAVERIAAENRRLRMRVAELEALAARLQAENESLTAARAAAILDPIEDMQPA